MSKKGKYKNQFWKDRGVLGSGIIINPISAGKNLYCLFCAVIASPWMVHPPALSSKRRNTFTYITAALLFIAAVLLFLRFRDQFISIFADLMGTPNCLLIFPFALGASPIGAALLVLSWYYVHPIPRLKEGAGREIFSYLVAFTPMILTTILLGAAMVISIFIRLL